MKSFTLLIALIVCIASASAFLSRGRQLSDDAVNRIDAFLQYRVVLQSALDTCAAKHNLDQDTAQKLVKMKIDNVTDNQKCFVNCIVDELEFYKNGQADMEKLKATIGPFVGIDILDTMIDGCETVKGETQCETAYKFLECTVVGYKNINKS